MPALSKTGENAAYYSDTFQPAGITQLRLATLTLGEGGVGWAIGGRFAGGGVIEPFATELAITSGSVAAGAGGALEAALDIALIDYTGVFGEGRLIRGDNPVLMTMELVLEAL